MDDLQKMFECMQTIITQRSPVEATERLLRLGCETESVVIATKIQKFMRERFDVGVSFAVLDSRAKRA